MRVALELVTEHVKHQMYLGPVRLTPYSTCSASFFNRNSVFLSQQFSKNIIFQPVSAKILPAERGLLAVVLVHRKVPPQLLLHVYTVARFHFEGNVMMATWTAIK